MELDGWGKVLATVQAVHVQEQKSDGLMKLEERTGTLHLLYPP